MNKFIVASLVLSTVPGWAALKRVGVQAPTGPESQAGQQAVAPLAPAQPSSGLIRRSEPSVSPPAGGAAQRSLVERRPQGGTTGSGITRGSGIKRLAPATRRPRTDLPSYGRGGLYQHYHHRGAFWYRFPYRDDYYWARLHAGRWWWYDTGFSRWVYWSNGSWLWPGPNGVTYNYVDNYYRPYGYGEEVAPPDAPPEEAPAPERVVRAAADHSSRSPDGRCEVQVIGERAQAFLYENREGSLAFVKYLGENVKDVRYSGPSGRGALMILVDFEDGTFALYDEKGEPVDVARTGGVEPMLPAMPAAPPQPQ